MNFMNMHTVVFGLAATTLLCALMLGQLYRHNRHKYQGLGLWLGAFLLESAGMFLLLPRGVLPESVSVGVANIAAMSSFVLLYAGLRDFWGRSRDGWQNLALLLTFSAIHLFFTFTEPDLQARTVNLNLWLALLFARCGWAVYEGAPPELRLIARLPGLAMAGFSVVSLARAGLALFGQPAHEFFHSGAADTTLVFLFQLLLIMLTFALFLMVNRRVLADTMADLEGRAEAEKALGGALKVAKLGTWCWDIGPNRLSWSDEMYTIFGLDREKFTGNLSEVIARVIHPDDQALVEAANRAVAEQGRPQSVQYRVLRPGGEMRWVHAEGSELVKDAGGRPLQLKGYAQDITERKLAEQRLLESAGRLELAVSSTGMGLWQLDIGADRRIFDRRVCELLGIAPDTFTGRPEEFFRALHPDDVPAVKAALAHTLETDTLYHPEYRVVWPDGSLHFISSRGRLRRDEQGRPWMVDGLLWDITDRKIAEGAMLSAQRLESLGALAGGIAHDFNNLLTGITANLSLLRARVPEAGETPELLKEAETACRAARNLAGQLLTFASGGKPVRKPLDFGRLARESAEFSLRGSGTAAEFSGDAEVFVLADRDQVFQAVQNLSINAAQAMRGAGTVRVEAAAVELGHGAVPGLAAGRYGAVTVRDSGPGMPPGVLNRLFEPYFSTKGTGRGLGLAVSRSIAARHGGTIHVASSPEGSAFTLYLPLTAERPEITGRRRTPARPAAAKGRVLVMDDEEIVHRALGRMLAVLGYEAEITTDGAMALAAWKAAGEAGRPFAVVILDLTVSGGMGGAEVMQHLRELAPEIKAIVSSGYAADPVMAAYREHGFSGVLPKPFQLDDLAQVLEELEAG